MATYTLEKNGHTVTTSDPTEKTQLVAAGYTVRQPVSKKPDPKPAATTAKK